MPFRVLSLDGGGAWALIEVRALIELYGKATTGHEVLKNFDLAAANSGGSLVLAGLIENLSLADIAQYFLDEAKRRSIFSPTRMVADDILRALTKLGPKYSTSAKLPAIELLLPTTGDAPFAGSADGLPGPGGSAVHLLIVGFDYDRNRAVFFRSAPARGPQWGDGQPTGVTLAQAVHASTNAPLNYFDAPAAFPQSIDRYWDGGITGCNNPSLVAVTEAIVLGAAAKDIHVLTLGSGSVFLPLAPLGAPGSPLEAQRTPSSLANDLTKLASAILDDPPDAATFIAHAITGGSEGVPPPATSRLVRMSPLVTPLPDDAGGWKPPQGMSIDEFRYICSIGMDAVQQIDIEYVDTYCDAWLNDLAPNQPIRMTSEPYDPWNPEIGYAKFSEAAAAWQMLFPRTDAVPTV